MKARRAAPVLMEYFRPGPRGGEDAGQGLDVVQEEALGPSAQLLDLARAAHLLDRLQEVHDLLGEGRLAHPAAPGAEHLDLAVQGRRLVLVQRADHVVGEGLVGVGVELAPGQADDVRRVQPRVLGVDGDEQLDDLARVERVEEDGRHLDAEVVAALAQPVQREQAVLAVEDAQDPVLLRDLQETEVVMAGHGREGEAPLRGDDHGAGNGGERRGVLALAVVGDQLVDLAPDDRALVGRLALADPPLETVPVDARAGGGLRLARLRAAWGRRSSRGPRT